ncbi:hypothetical protein Aau02nite_07710 [Amorphoplanes auranticolor]|uniref:Uncharacterized protein n=1 Tax=Actinoplanes auranticolor TaxID=47988 RepID=A0A919VJ46_9ACTN|nr:hypothetical protein Aau02nite_07710 [Actinoplanes auranticolor]
MRFGAAYPGDVLIVPGISLIIADTDERAREKERGALAGKDVTVTVPSEFALFTDRVLLILRERGVARREYEATTLRGNLGLPIPENVHTAARRTEPDLVRGRG